jgi:hypothetical protein
MSKKDRLAWMLNILVQSDKEPGIRWDLFRSADPKTWTLRRRSPDGERLAAIPDSEMQNRRTATAALERARNHLVGRPVTISLV